MRFIGWNLLFATWLLVSAFALPNSPSSQAATWVAAVAIGALGMVAVGRPAARFALAGVAVALALAALLVPDMSTAAAVNDGVVAAIVFALAVVQPAHVAAPSPASPRA